MPCVFGSPPGLGAAAAAAAAAQVGVWREYKLQDIVEMLDGMNYVCYMDGELACPWLSTQHGLTTQG